MRDAEVDERRWVAADGLAILVVLLGGTVLVVGWWGGVDVVTRLHPNLVSMKANTAVGLMALGIAAIPRVRASAWPLAAGSAGLAVALGGLTILAYAGIDVGIDQLLATDAGDPRTSTPGRMGLNTAMCFVTLGLALVLARRGTRTARFAGAQALALLTAVVALTGLLGYVHQVEATRGFGSATEMALHTSLGILAVVVAALPTLGRGGLLATTGGASVTARAARRTIPSTAATLLVIFFAVEVAVIAGFLDDIRVARSLEQSLAIAVLVVQLTFFARWSIRFEEQAAGEIARTSALHEAFGDDYMLIEPQQDVAETQHRFPHYVLPEVRAAIARASDGHASLTWHDTQRARTVESRIRMLEDGRAVIVSRDASDLALARDSLHRINAVLEERVQGRTQELADALREVEEQNTELERFAFVASHDLQEPLRMVTMFVGKLVEKYGDQLDDRGREYAHFAVDGAERMSALIRDLLRFSRDRTQPLQRSDHNMTDIAKAALASLTALQESRGAAITIADMPTARVDADLLQRLFQNLLTNALTHAKTDEPMIHVASATRDTGIVFFVEDNGPGVPLKHREDVFEMFRRLGSRTEGSGTGIGLPIVRQIAERHGGTAWYEDRDGGGARFCFSIGA